MRSPFSRLARLGRLAVAILTAFAIATPASAQFGGLKKKVKAKTGQEDAARGQAANAATGAPAAEGGTIVLTDDVVTQLVEGLKAGQAERDAAAKEDTPYGRYKRGASAYEAAKVKCEAGQQTFYQRAANDQKMLDKYSTLTEKMVAAQGKGDHKLMEIYQDSAMAMQDPSCVVKQPKQPDGYYDAERAIEARAEKQEVEASGLSPRDLAVVKERAAAILQGATAPGGTSPMEKAAVSTRSAELKPLLGLREQPPQVAKTAPVPAPAPTPAPAAAPQMSAAASSLSACVSKNMQSHQAEIEALGQRGQEAQAAGDTDKLMAIADTLQQIQMAGCR
ncbi:MAG TPA: hypothetical protein VJ808_14305 [Gemmatimonadales bacterium]|nr:hypothetical protein [Gemmatimonadales bacterium]